MSPSSRKAGIEIAMADFTRRPWMSPSSRKAGIEIVKDGELYGWNPVAFLTEGGD